MISIRKLCQIYPQKVIRFICFTNSCQILKQKLRLRSIKQRIYPYWPVVQPLHRRIGSRFFPSLIWCTEWKMDLPEIKKLKRMKKNPQQIVAIANGNQSENADSNWLKINTWLRVSINAVNEFWNCAVTVSGCFRVLIVVEFNKFCPALNVFTVCKFFKPFLGLSRGRNDLFFLKLGNQNTNQ